MDYKQRDVSVEERQRQLEELLFSSKAKSNLDLLGRAWQLFVQLGLDLTNNGETVQVLHRRFEAEFPVFVSTKLEPLVSNLGAPSVRWLLRQCLEKFNSGKFGGPDNCSVFQIVHAVGAKLGVKGHGQIYLRMAKFESRLKQLQNALTILESKIESAPSSSVVVQTRILRLSEHLGVVMHPGDTYCQDIQNLAKAIAPDEYASCLWDPFWVPGDEPFTWQVAAKHLGCVADQPFQTLVKMLGSVDPKLVGFEECSPEALLALRLKLHEFTLQIEALEAVNGEPVDYSAPIVERLQHIVDNTYSKSQPLFRDLVDCINQSSRQYAGDARVPPLPCDF